MTVTSSNSREQYNCSGGTTYTFTFGIGVSSELKVILTDGSGTETTLSETTHYTVTATNSDFSSGGVVTTLTAYNSPYTITILRNVPITQDRDFTEGMEALYETFEQGLDKLTRIAQQMEEADGRSLILPESCTASNKLPTPVSQAYLAWNQTADALQNVTLIERGSVSDEAYDTDTWNGVGNIAPSKGAVRDIIEARATSAEIITGTEAAKTIAPDQLAAALFHTKGAIPYASDINTPASLAAGAANLKMFMTAAGTAPEWAVGIKVDNFLRDLAASSGDVSYTGVGFKPSVLIFFACLDGTDTSSWGLDDGTKHLAIANNKGGSAGIYEPIAYESIYLYTGAGSAQGAHIKSFDSDGFTLTWTKTGSPQYGAAVYYIAFR